MAKRFTDSEKWEDPFFSNLTNDEKVIWFYMLDHCDNAGILKINIKNINYFCSTNITVEDLFTKFKGRITRITDDTCIINKFCTFQYGPDFLTSTNKAVISAIKKLTELGIIQKIDGTYTLSIGYQYPLDTPKEKEKEEEQVKEEVKEEVKVDEINKDVVQGDISFEVSEELTIFVDRIKKNQYNHLDPKQASYFWKNQEQINKLLNKN